MTAQGATAAGESAETTSTETQTQTAEQQPTAPSPRLLSVLEGLDLPAEVRDTLNPSENQDVAPETEPGPEETSEEQELPLAESEETQPAEAKAEVPPKEKPVKQEWPEDAKARVAEEKRKREERTAQRDAAVQERDQLKSRVTELEGKLKGFVPVRVNPTERDPLADVTNPQELEASKAQWKELQNFAERNLEGAFDVVIGKDAAGNEIKRDYTKEEMAEMRIKANEVLHEHVPKKEQYLRDRQQLDVIATELYPEMFDEGTPEHKIGKQLAQQMPDLFRFSDANLWIGRAIRGFKEEAKEAGAKKAAENGAAPTNNTVAALKRPQPPIAPAAVKVAGSRAPKSNGETDVDVEKAKSRFVEKGGGDEALEDIVSAARNKTAKRGGRQPALV